MKTETTDQRNKSSGQPTSRDRKPNCYECKHRGCVEWSAHSSCAHPKIGTGGDVISLLSLMTGQTSGAMKRLNISYSRHGFNNGWFNWPLDFDPVWLYTCDGFEQK